MIKRHAFLIMAQNEPKVYETLIRLLDDNRNDIFVHIDSKQDRSLFDSVKIYQARIRFVPSIKVYWGDDSIVEVEYNLLNEARKYGNHAYYHLLSGVDLPIKSMDYIHAFFCYHHGKEFVGISNDEDNKKDLYSKTSYFWPFVKQFRSPNLLVRKTCGLLRRESVLTQKMMSLRRKHEIELKKGPQWFSLTEPCVDYLLSKRNYIRKELKMIPCTDEIFLPSLVWNSTFRDSIFDLNDQFHSCMREIDWERGEPYIWQKEDLETLMHSDCLFAREFSGKEEALLTEIISMNE